MHIVFVLLLTNLCSWDKHRRVKVKPEGYSLQTPDLKEH
jgi:hypothetical protein